MDILHRLNAKMEPAVQTHMKNVYSCVAMSTLSAAVGACAHLYLNLGGGIFSVFGSLGFMLALMFTPDNGKNIPTRLGYLLSFALCSGLSLGPLLDVVLMINPAIVPTAFFATSLVFGCFTLAAMLSNHTKYLYLGGTLGSFLSVMMIASLLNIFLGSYLLFKAHTYIMLFVMCGFILFDTQMIMEKRRRGDRDFIWHSVDLFLDLIQIFRALLVILADKEDNKNKKK